MELDVAKTLGELVALPSVNPMGRDLRGEEFLEYRVTEYLESLFERLELPYQRQAVEPKRDNIIARIDGAIPATEGGPLLMFEAHQDTVPVDGMSIEPWTPTVRDGRLYGRGACDIKGGMAAMLTAFARLAHQRPRDMPTVVMACTVNEEHGYSGAVALSELWNSGQRSIIPRQPDACVVAEPTELSVVVAHKGAVRWRCRTSGRAVHSSRPEEGDNAIYKMSRVIAALEAYHLNIAPRAGHHRLCGDATLSVGTIRGGISVNTVPDDCVIEIDRRLLPGENPDIVYQEVIRAVGDFPGVDFPVEHETPYLIGLPLSDNANSLVADRLVAAAAEVLGRNEKIGVPYGTDASTFAAAGLPSVVFGPGSIEQAHTADEWVSIDQLESAAEIYYRFARDWRT